MLIPSGRWPHQVKPRWRAVGVGKSSVRVEPQRTPVRDLLQLIWTQLRRLAGQELFGFFDRSDGYGLRQVADERLNHS
jgi:hypothetical protein